MEFLLLVPLGVVKHESLLHCMLRHTLPSVNLNYLLSIPLQGGFFVLLICTDFFVLVLLLTSFAKGANQSQSRYVRDPCGSLPA